jgi:hypothetical protein
MDVSPPPPLPRPRIIDGVSRYVLVSQEGGGGAGQGKKNPEQTRKSEDTAGALFSIHKNSPRLFFFFSHSLLPKRVYHRLRVWKVCFVFIVLILLPFYV